MEVEGVVEGVVEGPGPAEVGVGREESGLAGGEGEVSKGEGGAWGRVVQVGGKSFEVSSELAEAMSQMDNVGMKELRAELATLREQVGRRDEPRDEEAGTKVTPEEMKEQFWGDPVGFVHQQIEDAVKRVQGELRGEYSAENTKEKVMAKFWADNKELKDYEDLVDTVAARHAIELRKIEDTQERMDKLANLASRRLLEIRGARSDGRGAALEGATPIVRGQQGPVAEEEGPSEVPESYSAALKMKRSKRSEIAASLGLTG